LNSKTAVHSWPAYLLLVLIVGMAWLVRDIAVMETFSSNPIRNDAKEYYIYAVNLKYFGVYSKTFVDPTVPGSEAPPADAERTPGYPLFLQALVEYPANFEMLGKILSRQALLDTVTVLLVFLIARTLMPVALALLPALLAAISPHLISMVTYPLTETLFTFLLTFAVAVGVLAVRHSSRYLPWLGFGLLLGLSFLVKTSMTYILFFALPLLFLVLPGKRLAAVAVLSVSIGYALAVLPWELRNAATIEEGVGAHAAHGVISLHNGTYPELMIDVEGAIKGFPHRFDPDYGSYDSYSKVLQKLWSNTLDEPVKYISWYLWGKPRMFFSWSIISGAGEMFVYPMEKSPFYNRRAFGQMSTVSWYAHWPLTLMALLTTLACWLPLAARRMSPGLVPVLRLISIPLLYLLALHTVTTPLPRYGIPLRPLVYVLACAGMWQAVLATRGSGGKRLYAGWDPLGTLLSRWRVAEVRKHLPGGVHLDIACGDNRLVKALGYGYGIDISAYDGTQVVAENFSELPFAANSLDSASILAALNYFESPQRTLQELQRSLKPGGIIVITLLSKNVSKYWHMLRDRKLPRITFDEDELKDIVSSTELDWLLQTRFMFGLNRLIVLRKSATVMSQQQS
jgi:SAM-dependent methyltransferase